MEFSVKKREAPKKDSGASHGDVHLAYTFAKRIWKEFDRFCKAIILFGSTAKEPEKEKGDIDVLIIVDDVSFYLTPEVVESYRILVKNHILATSKRLHVTTLKFTSFWEYIRVGDPLGLNILRDGVAMIDTGFFSPLQMLLYQGRIRPSRESVLAYLSRAPQTIFNSKWHVMQAVIDLYWAGIDACHAAIMKKGLLPPPPKRMPDYIQEHLVKDGLVDKRCVSIMRELYDTSKRILHRQVQEVSGREYDELLKKSQHLISQMKAYAEKKQ